jgi:hypothetical protein
MSNSLLRLRQLCITLAALAALPAAAQVSQLKADLNVYSSTVYPVREEIQRTPTLNLINNPTSSQWHKMEDDARTYGGSATASFAGRVGLLRATAGAGYGYCCTLLGERVLQGYSAASAQGSFFDTVLVTGAGLADGTPVSYRVDFTITGRLSSPNFEIGGFLSASGLAEVRLTDMSSRESVIQRWDATRHATGTYSLTLDTVVGRSLGISGMLYAGASVTDYAQLARTAWADFGHSAGYQLTPSVAGLNTVGASGWDFAMAPVPEPGSWGLMAGGLLVLVARRQWRPCLRRPSSKSASSSVAPTASGVMARP